MATDQCDKLFESMVDAAIAEGACSTAIDELSQFSSIEEAKQSDNAPEWVGWYARWVEDGMMPEFEYIILQSPWESASYAGSVLGERWLKAEPIILTCPRASRLYALTVIRGRWPEAEFIIRSRPAAWRDYIDGLAVLGFDTTELR